MREHFYFDTNVYRVLVEGGQRTEKDFVRKHRKLLKLASTTALELLEDLATCAPHRFSIARDVLEFARDTGHGSILPIREQFLAQRVFHTNYKSQFLNRPEISQWLDVAVRYRSKDELGTFVQVGALKTEKRLDIRYIHECQEEFRRLHAEMIRDYVDEVTQHAGVATGPRRGGPLSGQDAKLVTRFFACEDWRLMYVRKWGDLVGRPGLTPEQLDQLYPLLQPACEFLSTVLQQSLRDAYNFKRNANDAIDEAHLHYLCDPSLTFVTFDDRLRKKLSPNCVKRVITFGEFRSRITAS